MNSSLNYHASQARIDEMLRLSAPLQNIERETKTRSRGRLAGLFASLTPKSRPLPALRPSGTPAADKA